MEETLEEFLRRSAKSAGISGHWINETAKFLRQIAADPNDLHKYLKFKCLAASQPSSLFRGLVFTKAPACEQMPKTYGNPQIVIVEEDCNDSSILRQIEESGANVILVEKSISPDSFLLKYPQVTVVTEMKHRLHRFPTSLSTCESFESQAVIEDLRERKPVKSLIYFGGCDSFRIVLSGFSTYELKTMKGILKSGFNRLRNKVLSSAFYMLKFPPSVMIPPPGKVEEVSAREDEVSSLIALALQSSPNPCPGFNVSFLHEDSFRELRKSVMMSEEQYIGSLSRCDRWEAKGGKSGAVFAKTKDKRFIIKEINKTEYKSFALFGPKYFEYLSDPNKKTCLTKIFGMYEVTLTKPRFMMVMENIFFNQSLSEQYDLKGKTHGRLTLIPGEVLLDQNFIDKMKMSALQVCPNSKISLEVCIRNDAAFLSRINTMDYSLLLNVDDKDQEMVCGIIDYLAPYSFMKKVESIAKSITMIFQKEKPTVIPPNEYKMRFVSFLTKELLGETSLTGNRSNEKATEEKFREKLDKASEDSELDFFTWS